MAAGSKAAKGRAKGGAGGGLWFGGMACGLVMSFAPAIAVLCLVLLAPAGIAALGERGAGRPVARAMALCGGWFVLAPVWHLVHEGVALANAFTLLADPVTVGAAWFAGVFGWALCELVPVGLQALSDMAVKARVAQLERAATRLRDSWDLSDV